MSSDDEEKEPEDRKPPAEEEPNNDSSTATEKQATDTPSDRKTPALEVAPETRPPPRRRYMSAPSYRGSSNALSSAALQETSEDFTLGGDSSEFRDDSKRVLAWERPQELQREPSDSSLPGVYAIYPMGSGPLFEDEEDRMMRSQYTNDWVEGVRGVESDEESEVSLAEVPRNREAMMLAFRHSSSALLASCHLMFTRPELEPTTEQSKKRWFDRKAFRIGGYAGLVVLLALLVVMIVLLSSTKGGDSGATSNLTNSGGPTAAPTISPMDGILANCAMTNDIPSTRYQEFQSIITSAFPKMAYEIGSEGSGARIGLCWLADIDELQLSGTDYTELIQRFVLATFYYSLFSSDLNTPNGSFEGWVSASSVCDWEYVECSGNGPAVVRKLLVPNLELTGTLSRHLVALSTLTNLDIGGNHFGGEIPEEIWEMTQLEMLIIGSNDFVGTLSPRLSEMENLRHFTVAANVGLSGPLPDFGSLIQLESIYVIFNTEITGTIPNLTRLTNLDTLILTTMSLSGTIPTSIGDLNNLKTVDLTSQQLTGTIPTELGTATALENVQLSSNKLSGTIPSEIGDMLLLQRLELANIGLTGTIPTELGSLDVLETLSIVGSTQIEGPVPAEVCALAASLDAPCTVECECCDNQEIDC